MGMNSTKAVVVRSKIKNLSDLAGTMTQRELSRALVTLAFEIHGESAVNMVHKLEYERVKE